jgi:cytochrome P450
MVISETLRMYPPFIRLVLLIFSLVVSRHLYDRFDRVASVDYELGNYHIPKDSIINVPVYPIHHDPNVWPDPEKFIPER